MTSSINFIDIWRQKGYCASNPAPPCRKIFYESEGSQIKWAVHFHLGRNWDILTFFVEQWQKFPEISKPDVWITYHDDQSKETLLEYQQKIMSHDNLKYIKEIYWLDVPNKGADIGAFMKFAEETKERNYLTILKIHAKKSNAEWFSVMVSDLIPSKEWIEWFLDCHLIRNDLGMIAPTCDNQDYINYSYLLDLLIRSGIVPNPVYHKEIPSYQTIKEIYKKDERFIDKKYPAKTNQFRKNGTLHDAHIAWHLHKNPLGFMNDSHKTYMDIQLPPFLTNVIQQVYMISGTMFWIRGEICQQLNQIFPYNQTIQEMEEAIVKDNIWNKITHAWERFFSAYVSLNGYCIMDVKHKIQFKRLPYNLVKFNFTSYNSCFNKKLKEMPHLLPNTKLVPKCAEPNLPWFPRPGKIIKRGFASGASIWLSVIRKPINNTNITIGEFIERTRLPETRNDVWQHLWFSTASEAINWLQTEPGTEQMTTIWVPEDEISLIIEKWETTDWYLKFPKFNLEFMKDFFSYTFFYDFIEQIGGTFNENYKLVLKNFPVENESIKNNQIITLHNFIQNGINSKKQMPFWGQSYYPQWFEEYTDYNYRYKQLNVMKSIPINKNKIGIELISLIHNVGSSTIETLDEITSLIQVSASDFISPQKEFIVDKQFTILTNYYSGNRIHDLSNTDNWLLNTSGQSIYHFYPIHPIVERLTHTHANRNRSWEKNLSVDWNTFIRSCYSNEITINGTTKELFKPTNKYLWHVQLYIIPKTITDYTMNLCGIDYNEILHKILEYPVSNLNYECIIFKKRNYQNNDLEVWLSISCYHKSILTEIWKNVIINNLHGINWEYYQQK